ncbi:Ndr family protein [Acrocarpospora phusangensis]|uniref:Ndr family protein n=1 Tax=Acrocarpospora phusangensis TaxID=1070424 RepID=A0A919QEX4_9ACTN|nr:alpha/beta fold hydrolase [Acrocarpospora phusangensis]GIH27682.1 Ndr family protein [Acrocarpospora phusangensis]
MIYKSEAGARQIERRYREYLADWPVPSEQITVPTGAGDTFVLACGPADAPPVLLLHGSASNAAMWRYDVETWSRDFRLYAIDMIGEPGLSARSRPELGSEAYARWLDEVLAGLGVASASIVGMSLGGWLALDYAVRRPDRVERLALVCPAGVGRQKVLVLLGALLLQLLGRGRAAMHLILGVTEDPGDAAFADYVLLIHRHFRPRRERIPLFTDEELGRLTMPVLAVVGGRDAMLDSAATKARLETAAPDATVRLLPEAGHLVPSQNGPILEFLRTGMRSTAL